MSRFICNDSPTANVALLRNYATGYHPARASKKRDVDFNSRNMHLLTHENSALMVHSKAVPVPAEKYQDPARLQAYLNETTHWEKLMCQIATLVHSLSSLDIYTFIV